MKQTYRHIKRALVSLRLLWGQIPTAWKIAKQQEKPLQKATEADLGKLRALSGSACLLILEEFPDGSVQCRWSIRPECEDHMQEHIDTMLATAEAVFRKINQKGYDA